MRFANASKIHRKSGVRWGERGAPVLIPQVSLAAGGENFRQLLWRNHFELRVGTVAQLLVCAPSAELRHVPETAALHVLVSNFHHQLRP
jgi:hypothetical protein